ncbi:predicted protein [Postia placenta Mad-698-R]|nr:predicted protein [Postia placenta Mad-698-R]
MTDLEHFQRTGNADVSLFLTLGTGEEDAANAYCRELTMESVQRFAEIMGTKTTDKISGGRRIIIHAYPHDVYRRTCSCPSQSATVRNYFIYEPKSCRTIPLKYMLTTTRHMARERGGLLEPDFAKAAAALLGTAKLARVDCSVRRDVCSAQDIRGYPADPRLNMRTLRAYRHGHSSDYNGRRDASSIVDYMRRQKARRNEFADYNRRAEYDDEELLRRYIHDTF